MQNFDRNSEDKEIWHRKITHFLRMKSQWKMNCHLSTDEIYTLVFLPYLGHKYHYDIFADLNIYLHALNSIQWMFDWITTSHLAFQPNIFIKASDIGLLCGQGSINDIWYLPQLFNLKLKKIIIKGVAEKS